MFKKLNLKKLLIIFGGLFVLVVILKLCEHNKGDRNFRANFFEIDTAKISAISIISRGSKEEVRIIRSGKFWNLIKKNKSHRAEKGAVESIISEIQNMKPDYVAAMEKSEWPQYQVTDTGSTRVKVEEGKKLVADFLVGKLSFKQYQQTTYVRLYNEDNVYAVNGILAMTFNREANDFRDKSMVRIGNPSFITKLAFNYPDSSFTLVKEQNGWNINGIRADSAKIMNYLNSIISLNGSDFVEDSEISGNQAFSIQIDGNNFKPIELKAFIVDAANQYIITSSSNSVGRFSGAKGDLAKRVFVGLDYFKANKTSNKSKSGKK